MFKNRNFAFERSQKYHAKRMFDNGTHQNALICDYHMAVFSEQDDKKIILSKKRRKKLYKKYVLDYLPEFRNQ